MTAQQLKVAVSILKETTHFELGQVSFKAIKDKEQSDLLVFSEGIEGESVKCFYATEIIKYFEMFNTYLDYNRDTNKIFLRIY